MTKADSPEQGAPDREKERRGMLQEVERDFAETARFTGLATLDPNVRGAMLRVKRHLFVSPSQNDYAYVNHALPIARQQTISQPFIVALMTALLQPRPGHVVLEVGTGSGYQAAVLSLLTARLYSIERIAELAASAADRLRTLGYDNVEVRCSDGALGWPEHAPFDGIIVTAGANEVPPALCEQLKTGGRLVIPVGRGGLAGQNLQVLTKQADGSIEVRSVLPVAFVPLLAATA